MRNHHLAGLLVGAVLAFTAACGGTTGTEGAPTSPAGAPSATTTPPQPAAVSGYTVRIPTLGVSSSLVGVGLNPDRTMQVPPLDQPGQAAVYERGPMPGEVGPAIILGHVNGSGRPGIFARLAELDEGDVVEVDTPTGPRTFEVYDVETLPKEMFPTARVYSDTDGPELRLITCGPGETSGGHYLDQTVVFAHAT